MSEPFALSPIVPDPVAPGTNLLVTGPPTSDKREILLDLLAASFDGDAAIVVSTKGTARELVETLTERTGRPDRIHGVECAQDSPENGDGVTSVTSPADLTGISMHVDRHLGEFAEAGLRPRLGLCSISTLLVYSDLQPVYRFLHVTTGRVAASDGLGLFVVDSDSHDEQAMSAIASLFDGRVRVAADGETSVSGL